MKRQPKKWTVLILGALFLSSIITQAQANDLSKRLGFGLGWPYLSLKYGISPRFSIEGRGAFGEGIGVYGARLYYNFNPEDRAVIFTGLEGDYVNFDVDIEDEEEGMKGKGYVGYLFVGGEYFINDNFTFNLDIGPAYIDLTEGEFDFNVSGIEWLYNLGINLYFGSSVKKEKPERPREVIPKEKVEERLTEVKIEEIEPPKGVLKEETVKIETVGNLKAEIKLSLHPKYTKFYVKIRNTANTATPVSPYNFILQTKDGEYHTVSTQTFSEENPLIEKSLNSNQVTEGFILFETKESPRRLTYEDYLGNSIIFDF